MVAILYNIRSVHNVGSIFRTADAAGIEKLYVCGVTPIPLDRFGNKRGDFVKVSLGAEDSVTWEKIGSTLDSPEIFDLLERLRKEGYAIVSLEQSHSSVPHTDKNIKVHKNIALIVGNEVKGLPESILKASDYIIEIPMRGDKESLNVSVSFGIAAYELKKSGD